MISSVGHIPSMSTAMTPFPFYVEPGDSLRRARELMSEHEVRHLPVLEDHRLVGILTDRDMKRVLDPDLGMPPKDELFVRDAYLPEPYVVDSSAPLDVVLEHMAEHHIGSALVTKHGRLVGIFTAMDACRAYCEHLRKFGPRAPGAEVA
jgi:acetoin utilization protein AcuB